MRRSGLRGWWRALVLVFSLCQCLVSFLTLRLRGEPSLRERALWLHRSCGMVLGRLGIRRRIVGELPARGLIASNHLSYLDILLYGATVPCVFVSKVEVRGWPLLGLLAALGGTVFVDRKSAASTVEAAGRIEDLLKAGVLVLVFPEGTSSDGAEVLRFHASLFEPAVRVGVPVTAAAIGYSSGEEAAERDLCYYGDISFAPHLLKTLQLPEIVATLRFGSPQVYDNRKQASRLTREAVVGLRANASGGMEGVSTG
jgi:lyso-ornithine lipid O-acyltransferase